MRPLRRPPLALVTSALVLAAPALHANNPPLTPIVLEPAILSPPINPADVHMVTADMIDFDPGDLHVASDWEIWTTAPLERVWFAHGLTDVRKVHVHLGDGQFENSHVGRTELIDDTSYRLLVRHRDDSGDPATEWSPWSPRSFTTGAASVSFPMELDDVADAPAPTWVVTSSGLPVGLPASAQPARLVVEGELGELLLALESFNGVANATTNPAGLVDHVHARVRLVAGALPLDLPETDLTFYDPLCGKRQALLPAITLPAGAQASWWITSEGASYVGQPGQTEPDFSTPARLPFGAWVPIADGFAVDEVASGFQLPVDIAFVPEPGPDPSDPLFYVTELYGAIRVVANDGTVGTYASGLLNFSPSGVFPGNGELGVTGVAVEPESGDLFVSMLRDTGLFGGLYQPEVRRFTSADGGRTASGVSTVIAFPGEGQGPSHQISNVQMLGDGTFLVHMGDGFDSSTALDPTSYRGKILRVELDGSAPDDNPFYDAGNGIDARDYTWCLGVRNPFGGDLRASDGFVYTVENGPGTDRMAKLVPGADFGWAGFNGNMSIGAILTWTPATGPVDVAFVQPTTFGGSGFPADLQDRAYVSLSGPTYATGPQSAAKRIVEIELDATGGLVGQPVTVARYVGEGKESISGIAAGPDGLYFATLYEELGSSGPSGAGARVMRLRWSGFPDCNQNGVEDVCDIAAGTSADGDGDGIPDECGAPLSLVADGHEVSVTSGGVVTFALSAPAPPALNAYLLLGSASGTSPGLAIDAVHLPLNFDAYFVYSIASANGAELTGTFGTLAPDGSAASSLVLPPALSANLAGKGLDHAALVFDLAGTGPLAAFASNPVALRFVP